MKRKLLLLTVLLSAMTAWAGVMINEENFPDENFRNWVLGQSYGKDRVLKDDEIAGVTEINVKSKYFQSLKGIEFFTALTKLDCSSNQLTLLDVSKNTALTRLVCRYNQLTSLDVLGCTALKELICYDNQLTSLDVSKNTALEELSCNDNQLTSLDVSGCTALEYLNCYDNQLTSLDVSGCTALKSLMCYNNHLTSLDVSGCTALWCLECSDNRLTSLDVSKNTALEELSCSSNQLASIDVSRCTALKQLFCYGNQIKDAGMDALVESLPTISEGNATIWVLYVKYEQNVMTTVQVEAAKAKGWKVYYHDGNRLQEYAGSIPTGIEDLTPALSEGEGAVYNIAGLRINNLRKGLNIVDGKKLMVR